MVMALCAALCLGQAAAASLLPQRADITYAVYMGSLKIGEGRDLFEHDGGRYSIVSESRTAGVAAIYPYRIKREARGAVTPGGLRPETYDELRNDTPKRRVRFDWTAKQATLFDGKKERIVELPDDTWDMTSFGYNFAFFSTQAKELAVNLTDGRRISPYRYAVLGREKLDTRIGTLDTLRVKKVQAPSDPRAFEVWLAIERHYAPVRIRYTEKDGTVFDSVVTGLTFSPK
jgi:hypothetical protein